MNIDVWTAEQARLRRERIAPFLKILHTRQTTSEPAEAWAPSSWGGRLHPVVIDANILRNDILRRVRGGHRTILLTGGSKSLRLFCAPHVIREVYRHASRWADEANVTSGEILLVFESEYAPLIRIVEPSLALLTAEEATRIKKLAGQDPDDIPSVTLAMLLGAFYLSEDRPACNAAYGRHMQPGELRAWLDVLRAGSDARQLTAILEIGLQLTHVTSIGVAATARELFRRPWLLMAVAAASALAAAQWTPKHNRTCKKIAVSVLRATGDVAAVANEAGVAFRLACVPQPSKTTLSVELTAGRLLIRAAMFDLARTKSNDVSAAQLSERLWRLPITHGDQAVRGALRSGGVFEATARGRWQLGQAVPAWSASTSGPAR